MVVAFALLLASGGPQLKREFVWSSDGITHRASLLVEEGQGPRYTTGLTYQGAHGKKWENRLTDDDGPLLRPPQVDAVRIARGGQLIRVNTQVPNWNRTTFWVAGDKKTEPLVFKHRDLADNAFMYGMSAKGEVVTLTFFDRWVGGRSKAVIQNGKRLDRWEEISTYSVSSTGLRFVERHRRLIPYRGGGKSEHNAQYF